MDLPYTLLLGQAGFENMINPFQFGTSLFVSQSVLIAMGFSSLVFYLSLRSKSLAVGKLPKNLSANVFNKTFNIFDPYPDQRKTIQSSVIVVLPILTLFGAVILSFVVMARIIEAGFLLGSLTFAFCAALMTLEETFEIHSKANIFVRAIKNGTELGEGDLTVLSIVKETLPKLKTYYLSLAIIFFASSMILPYVLPGAMFIFVRFITAPIESAPSQGIFAAYYTVLLLVAVTLTIPVIAGKIKSKIFGFPPQESLVSSSKPFELMKQWVSWHMHELAYRKPPEPDETPDSERRKD
jgi:hypothetical protein